MSLSNSDLKTIRDYIESRFSSGELRVKTDEVFDFLQQLDPALDKNSFKTKLREAFRTNRLPGLQCKRGRFGGISKIKESSAVVAQITTPEPAPESLSLENKVIGKTEVPPEVKPKSKPKLIKRPAPPLEPARTIVRQHELIASGKTYRHNMGRDQFLSFMKNVIEVFPADSEECENYNVFAFDERYELNEDQLKFLDRLLFFCFGASTLVA